MRKLLKACPPALTTDSTETMILVKNWRNCINNQIVCMDSCMHLLTHVCLYACMHVCMYVFLFVYMHVWYFCYISVRVSFISLLYSRRNTSNRIRECFTETLMTLLAKRNCAMTFSNPQGKSKPQLSRSPLMIYICFMMCIKLGDMFVYDWISLILASHNLIFTHCADAS